MKLTRRGQTWYVEARINGTRRRVSTGTKDKAEAARLMPAIVADLAAEGASTGDVGGMTLAEGFQRLWDERGKRLRDRNGWKQRRDDIIEVLGARKPLADITRDDLLRLQEDFMRRPGKGELYAAPATVNRKMALLSTLLNAASRDWGVIGFVPRIPKLKVPENRRAAVTPKELEEVLAESRPQYRFLWRFLAETGLRTGEWTALRWEHIDLDEGKIELIPSATVHIKADNRRVVWLTEETHAEFKRRHDAGMATPFEGITYNGQRYEWDRIRKVVRPNDKRFVPYSLRHACATNLVNQGVPTATIQKWMGHSNIETTLNYVHHADEDLKVCAGRV